jgi:cell division protein FtsB
MQSPWEKLKQFHWNDRRLILVAVIILLVLLMMDFNNRMVRALELEEQAQAMTTRMAELEQTKVYLEAQIAYATSEKAVEQWAREDAKLIKEGDVPIIILPPSKPTPTPTSAPLVQEEPLSNFEIWKALFLGE